MGENMNIMKDENGRTLYYVAADVLLLKDNKVLLQKRQNTGWCDGYWNLIGGHLEEEESIEECVAREAWEELGIKLEMQSIKPFHCLQHKTNRLTIQFYLVCTKWQGKEEIKLGLYNGKMVYKASALKWFDVHHLPENIVPTAKRAIEAYYNKTNFSRYGF